MAITTVGKMMVNRLLPADMPAEVTLGKNESDAMLAEIARRYPERYREISSELSKLGGKAAYLSGSTLKLSDTLAVVDKAPYIDHVVEQTRRITADDTLSRQEKRQAIEGVYSEVQAALSDRTYEEALKRSNPFALQVKSKSRGSPAQLAALMTTPGLYEDAKGRIIPTFIRRSYAEGLEPHEYWAGTYGARKSVIATKFSTRQGGYLGKQLNAASNALIVAEEDCGTGNGLPVPSDSNDNIGSVLARNVGGIKAGTVITRPVLAKLQSDSDEIVVRSPITCATGNGVCKQCAGIRESGNFPDIGYNLGINAGSAMAERIAQSALNTKHSGGIAGAKGEIVYAGFPVVEQLAQVPKNFPHAAPLASAAGEVENVSEAAQGGYNILIGGKIHYAPQGQPPMVKAGDMVEAGDQLAAGIINPREVVQYKGLGEGRRYMTERMTQAFRDSNYTVNRRNVEAVSRTMLDYVQADNDDGVDGALPGEILSYNAVARRYAPREDASMGDVNDSIGKYLEQPALHYTIGTEVTKSVAGKLAKNGFNSVLTHKLKPGFEPVMYSLREVPHHKKDWMAQLGSSYLKSNLLASAHRGAESQAHGVDPIPALAKGTEIGKPLKGQVGY